MYGRESESEQEKHTGSGFGRVGMDEVGGGGGGGGDDAFTNFLPCTSLV